MTCLLRRTVSSWLIHGKNEPISRALQLDLKVAAHDLPWNSRVAGHSAILLDQGFGSSAHTPSHCQLRALLIDRCGPAIAAKAGESRWQHCSPFMEQESKTVTKNRCRTRFTCAHLLRKPECTQGFCSNVLLAAIDTVASKKKGCQVLTRRSSSSSLIGTDKAI
jgi:hypothetical protein